MSLVQKCISDFLSCGPGLLGPVLKFLGLWLLYCLKSLLGGSDVEGGRGMGGRRERKRNESPLLALLHAPVHSTLASCGLVVFRD